jgi:hypothetical protein
MMAVRRLVVRLLATDGSRKSATSREELHADRSRPRADTSAFTMDITGQIVRAYRARRRRRSRKSQPDPATAPRTVDAALPPC